jgi:hypothetical protein
MGYPYGTVRALVESRNFKWNHLFLIEVWEGMYIAFIEMFLKAKGLHWEATAMEEVEARLEAETMEEVDALARAGDWGEDREGEYYEWKPSF